MSETAAPNFPPGYAEETLAPRLEAIAIAFIVLEIVVVALRFATRIIYKTRWGADDYLIPPALLFSLGMCVIAIVETRIAGVGKHLAVLYVTNPQAVVNWAKCGYAIECIYSVAVAFPKLSILASYLRIFTTKAFRVSAYVLIVIVSLTAASGVITSLASCRPFSARWDPALFVSNCIDAPRFWAGLSVPNVATDVVMLLLPLPVVWRLHMDKRQKVALSAVFLLGSIGIIASVIRLTVTSRVSVLTDGTWDSADIATWSLVESGCYLIASCLPVLRPMYTGLISRFTHISSRSYGPKSSGARTTGDEDESAFVRIEMDTLENGPSNRWSPQDKRQHV
ncbi:integral membrane protein [Apiospora arundinis]|uniref:Integral membrane protein n=1 Tax=Apiospora arundinis TaxID=335852 RepID=A0ABR2IBE7_9PEZI